MSGPTISLLELKDEFGFVRNDANYEDVARALSPNSVKTVLVRGKKNKSIAGAISETHFLKVCKTGINPTKTLARNQMLTDLLRLRDDTPIDHAVEVIEERDPDAVLVLNSENKFVGYLSPQDFKELQAGQERISGNNISDTQPLTSSKGDVSTSLNLGDEFTFVRNDAIFSDASRMLTPAHVKVILVRAKKGMGVAGVLTEPEFLKVCATGINPDKTLVSKHMLTDLLRIRSDTPLEEAVKIIGEKDPDAVLVLNAEKKFVGYLSPADYNEAIELLKKKKIEVFDVPAIKPEIAPPPPPPPPALETSLLDELIEEESDLTHTIEDDIISVDASSITAHIRNLISKDSTDVVWSEDGSEVVVHTSSLSVDIGDGSLTASIEMSCDQCPRSAIIASFFLGKSDDLSNLNGVREQAPAGPKILVGRWGRPFQDVVWSAMLEQGELLVNEYESNLMGIGAGPGTIKFSNSKSPMHVGAKVGGGI